MRTRQSSTLRQDFVSSLRLWPLWSYLSWIEIKMRYRGTVLGPFWTSISMAVFVAAIGFIYSQIGRDVRLAEYMPYLAAGYLAWMLIFRILVDGSRSLISASPYLKQMPLPYTLFAFTNVMQNIIVFLHHCLVYLALFPVFNIPINANVLFLLPGMMLIVINGLWVSMFLGMVAARYRDIEPLTQNILQIALFVTPIIWQFDGLSAKKMLLVDANPLFHFIQIIRAPLLGQAPTLLNWEYCGLVSVIGVLSVSFLFNRYRARIIYWL